MNLHQFRVLSAVLRLPERFTTIDLVREAGVSADVVRKTYQRYDRFFTVVEATKPKLRSLSPGGRDELLQELKGSRSLLAPPPAVTGPEGEPLGLTAAERVLSELVPVSDAEGRAALLREARSHLELAEQERELATEAPLSFGVEVRFDAVRHMLDWVEVLHGACTALAVRVPDADLSRVAALATALIDSAAARGLSREAPSRSVCAGLHDLLALRTRAPEEADRIAQALLALAKEPAWCHALSITGALWTPREEALLAGRFRGAVPGQTSRADEPVAIMVDCWDDEAKNSNDPVRATTARLYVAFGDKVATRHLDPLSRAVEDSAPLSAYPLALWLASSWWQLRWDCRQEHRMAAAGNDFVWPPLYLSSNGERIYARCGTDAPASVEAALQYFEKFDVSVPAADFERAVDGFIKHVLGRLTEIGNTELHTVWQQLILERSDSATSVYRRLEAMLGLNRGAASTEILVQLGDLADEAGPSSRDELAWASENNSIEVLTKAAELARSSEGVRGHIAVPPSYLNYVFLPGDEPWVKGHKIARACRKYCNFGFDPIGDASLGDTLNVSQDEISDGVTPAKGVPFSLAVRNRETGNDRFLFHSAHRYFRRFEAARFLADSLLAHADDRWLLGTRARTARQQAQRAFANEFIAPIEPLMDSLGDDHSDEKLEEAALHWGLGSNMLRRHVDLNAKQRLERSQEAALAFRGAALAAA